jgi:hypothetical protein
MSFKLTFRMDNAAFDTNPQSEAAAILRRIAQQIEAGHLEGVALDLNGNMVGTWEIAGRQRRAP